MFVIDSVNGTLEVIVFMKEREESNMKFTSVFDIIGPVMIGPSSSHTAGAARIGRVARDLFGRQPKWVKIYLYSC